MPTFEIEAPNGQILEIDGDTMPTEQELDDIFKQTNTNTQQPTKEEKIANANAKYQQAIEQADKEWRADTLKNGLGGGLMGASMHPIFNIPYVGTGLGGALYSTGDAISQGKKGFDILGDAGRGFLIGETIGSIPYVGKAVGKTKVGGAVAGALGKGVTKLANSPVGRAYAKALATKGGQLAKEVITGVGEKLGQESDISKGTRKLIGNIVNNPTVQKRIGKIEELLTSVPNDYFDLALQNELKGTSILNGKFDANTAYQPIERQLKQAKSMLPNSAYFADQYNKLSNNALAGLENVQNQASNDIVSTLSSLNDRELANGSLKNAIDTVIRSYGEGGVYNSARETAPQVVNKIENALNKDGLTLRDLHRIKEDLYDVGYQLDGLRQGTGSNVARGTANQINNYLRGLSPEYAKANDIYSFIADNVARDVQNGTTLGSKIGNIGSDANIVSGLDARLKQLDDLLPKENKFFANAQNLIEEQNAINNINSYLGKQYERNPRLLANRTDEGFESALNDLQNQTGINFMDDLNKLRAREALEKWLPGQGGGSGSSQGAGNLIRAGLAGSGLTAGAILHNPLALMGVASMSPKLGAKTTIQNLGRLNRVAEAMQNSPIVEKLLAPLVIKGTIPRLEGGVEYYEYR